VSIGGYLAGISWVRDCKKLQKTRTDETCHRVILWVDFSVGRGSAVGRAHACALARLHRFVLLSAGTLCPTIRAMMSIGGHGYGRWVSRRRALAARLIVMHSMGCFLDELGVLLRAYRRASKEVALPRDRPLHVTAASLSLKRSSLWVQRRRVFSSCLTAQSSTPTPKSPHPSSTESSGKQSSFRAFPSHANPALPLLGARQGDGLHVAQGRSAAATKKREIAPVHAAPGSEGVCAQVPLLHSVQQPKHQARELEAPRPDVPLRCPAMQVSRPKACG